MFKNTASQKLTVFAFDSTTNLPKTGDAANLTAYVSINDGTVTVLGDTSATEADATNANGYYTFDLAQAETNGDKLLFSAKSSTSNIVVMAMPAVVYTVPANFTAAAITSGGIIQSDIQTIKTNAVTCAAAVTVGAYVGNATAALGVDASGRVDVGKVLGTAQTARDLGANLDVAVSSRMASYTQPTGFLTATFPSGTIANTTNITAASGITVSTNSDKTGYSLTQAFPTNFASLAITAGGIAKADLQTILATAISETTGGNLAAAFKKLLDVSSPVLTTASVNQTGDSYARIGAAGAGLTSLAPASTALSTAQWTNTRAGYLDNLSAGSVGSPMQAGAHVQLATTQDQYAPAKAGDAMTLTAAYDAAKTAAQAGNQMDLVNAPNATAITAIQNGLATSAALSGLITTVGAAGAGLTAIFTTQMTESYRATGAAPTPAQALFETLAHLGNSANSGTTKTLKKLDKTTTAKTYTYDDGTTPTSIAEAT